MRCPDCPAVAADGHLEHARTCPLGRAIDETSAADAAWFQARPYAIRYYRPITRAEVAELRAVGLLPDYGEVVGKVQVIQLEPGIRARRFGNVAVVIGSAA